MSLAATNGRSVAFFHSLYLVWNLEGICYDVISILFCVTYDVKFNGRVIFQSTLFGPRFFFCSEKE